MKRLWWAFLDWGTIETKKRLVVDSETVSKPIREGKRLTFKIHRVAHEEILVLYRWSRLLEVFGFFPNWKPGLCKETWEETLELRPKVRWKNRKKTQVIDYGFPTRCNKDCAQDCFRHIPLKHGSIAVMQAEILALQLTLAREELAKFTKTLKTEA